MKIVWNVMEGENEKCKECNSSQCLKCEGDLIPSGKNCIKKEKRSSNIEETDDSFKILISKMLIIFHFLFF